jgi:hypothetical protein
MTIGTEFAGIRRRIAAISANKSLIASSEVGGATHVMSNTTLDAGVFAQYPKSWNRSLLQIGASPARV